MQEDAFKFEYYCLLYVIHTPLTLHMIEVVASNGTILYAFMEIHSNVVVVFTYHIINAASKGILGKRIEEAMLEIFDPINSAAFLYNTYTIHYTRIYLSM